jgi:hypothetical protein
MNIVIQRPSLTGELDNVVSRMYDSTIYLTALIIE